MHSPVVTQTATTPARALKRSLAVGLAVLLVAVSAQIAVPIPLNPVPVTLQPLAVLVVGGLLGAACRCSGTRALPRARHYWASRCSPGAPPDSSTCSARPADICWHFPRPRQWQGCATRERCGVLARVLVCCAAGHGGHPPRRHRAPRAADRRRRRGVSRRVHAVLHR